MTRNRLSAMLAAVCLLTFMFGGSAAAGAWHTIEASGTGAAHARNEAAPAGRLHTSDVAAPVGNSFMSDAAAADGNLHTSDSAGTADEPGNVEASESGLRPVQVFDVAQGRVVKSVPNDAKFQKMANSWITSITGLAPQVSAGEGCSYVYRVPLARQTTIATGTIQMTTNDLFLFYCKDKPPLLLAFDDQRKPYLFLFKADIRKFVKKVGLPADID